MLKNNNVVTHISYLLKLSTQVTPVPNCVTDCRDRWLAGGGHGCLGDHRETPRSQEHLGPAPEQQPTDARQVPTPVPIRPDVRSACRAEGGQGGIF